MYKVLLLVLISFVQAQEYCQVVIDSFNTTALGQGLEVKTGSFEGSFGEQIISALKPVVELRAKGAITSDMETFSYGAGSCTVGYIFSCTTGTTAYGYGVLRSALPVVYHPGESIIGRWTQAIVTPCWQGDCLLTGGMFTTTDGLLIGLRNNVFSVGYQHHGNVEMQTLTITAAATSASTVTVTVSGVAVVVSLTVSTAQTNAAQIAAALTAATLARPYFFEQVDNKVLATGQSTDEVVGAFAYAAGTTGSTASWAENTAAARKIETWITRPNMQGVAEIEFLNETSMNVYQIIYAYLGIANIQYQVLNPEAGKFVTMHTIRLANTQTDVSLRAPSMKIGWIAYRPTLGNANYQITGGSAQMSRVGLFDESLFPTWGSNVEVPAVTAGAEKYCMSIRAQRTSNSQIVLSKIRIVLLSVVTDSTKGAIVRVVRNCVISGTPNWQYISATQSVTTVDKAATGCTGGELVMTELVGASGYTSTDTSSLNLVVPVGETLTVTAQLLSGANSEVDVAITWSEDY